MDEVSGWLFDVYEHPERGILLWVIADSGERLRLRMDLSITFYLAGDFKLLRAAWIFLKGKAELARARRRDLFLGERDVMQVTLTNNSDLVYELQTRFPGLDYYDIDIPVTLRFIARSGVHLLGRCRFTLIREWVQTLQALDSPWELSPEPIPLRVMEISPNADPVVRPPTRLALRFVEGGTGRGQYILNMEPERPFLISLQADLRRFDPDLILTDHGDGWLLPTLTGIRFSRDRERGIQTCKANSYFAYGQVIHRGMQSHLFGRWHVDRRNAMMFNEYGLEGVLEQTRVTGIGVQEMARKSPGAGITAMQMLTALRMGVMIPLHKQQVEGSKTLAGLIRADKGGLIYQPLIGVHRDVAQIDFASMYPSIMVNHNISPETTGRDAQPAGLIPQTLKPLLEKRLQMKRMIGELNAQDCELKPLKARAAALKWLLVVCFGYLGYKNARFGRIESHEAVTSISRELMLQAKEVAEDQGFTVLHMYVDSLFVQKEGLKERCQFLPLLAAISAQTKIAIALDGVYRWIVFPPSRRDARVPVPNRYFGVFGDGKIKVRGMEARRRDTPLWVKKIQLEVLKCLAKAGSLDEVPGYLPEANQIVRQAKHDLQNGRVPLEELVVTQNLSRAVAGYASPSPAARAAFQLQAAGMEVAPGQFVRFVFVRGRERVRVWELGVDGRMVDIQRYCALLNRAVDTVLSPFEKGDAILRLF